MAKSKRKKGSKEGVLKKDNSIFKTRVDLNKAIIDIYRKGGNSSDVEAFLKENGREKTVRQDIFNANIQIKEEARLERESLIRVHVKRYSKIFEENFNKKLSDFSHLPENIRRFALLDRYSIAMSALVAKEKVLGLHSKQFRFQLNNYFRKKVVSNFGFNSSKLDDLVLLLKLINKMKTNVDLQVFSQYDDLSEEIKTIFTTKTEDEVQTNETSVSKIKEEIKPILESENKADTVLAIQQKIVENDLKSHNPARKNLLDKLKNLDS